MVEVVCSIEEAQLPDAEEGVVPVLLFGRSSKVAGCVGGPVWGEVRRLGYEVPQVALDFLALALAVVAADSFVNREFAADRWCRDLRISVPVANPIVWRPLSDRIGKLLSFLSGDRWSVSFRDGGVRAPQPQSRGRLINVEKSECVCLFSGGLDSAIGALDLVAQGEKPLLVSHAYGGDASYQERVHQLALSERPRFAANANPTRGTAVKGNDVTMRTRSFGFLAFGAVAAAVLAKVHGMQVVPLVVPENGWIALNPPLTRRRIGALSTRTTHPHFLDGIQAIFDSVGIPASICNPYALSTKGEMIEQCGAPERLRDVLAKTVSCGNWKRKNRQCGRCVPCLIRRAAIHRAGIPDQTPYLRNDLHIVAGNESERDDLLAVRVALRRAQGANLLQWVGMAGPLPDEKTSRESLVSVFERGLEEMASFLSSVGFWP